MKYLLAMACCLPLFVSACGSSSLPTRPIRHSYADLQWGVVTLSNEPTLDPALASDATSITLDSLVYGGLVRLDKRLQVQPDGAARWTISRDGRSYIFYLRRDLRFSDGTEVTASDFVHALQRALGPDGAAGAASFYLASIARQHATAGTSPVVSALNAHTVSIRLAHPSAHFLTQLAFPASYVPEFSVMNRYASSWTDHAAGFGPYRVQEWNHTRSLRLVRNPYYWRGLPTFKRITVHFYAQNAALAAYRGGSLDVVSGLPAAQMPAGILSGERHVPALALDYLAFNTRRLPFFRLNARRAFAAVWLPRFVRQALQASAFSSTSFLPSAFGISVPRWTPDKPPATYLARARYPHARNFPTLVLAAPPDPAVGKLARELAAAWHARLGVQITVRQLDPSIYDGVLASHSFDLALVRWGAEYADPQDFLGTQLGSSRDNLTGWTARQYDADIALADSYSPTDPRRLVLFRRAASLAARKLPLLPLDEPAQTALIRSELFGVSITPLGTIAGDWAHLNQRF